MIGSIIVMMLGIWALCLAGGIILAHLTWTPPGQSK